MNFFYSYQTDRGMVRASNQDSLMVKVIQSAGGQAFLAAVCDGVGGLTHGELTSRKTVEMLGRWAEYELPGLLADVVDGKVLKKRLQHLIQDINREIYFDNRYEEDIFPGSIKNNTFNYLYSINFVDGQANLYVYDGFAD